MMDKTIIREIDKLEADALKAFNVESRAAQLDRVKDKVKEAKENYQTSKKTLSETDYVDSEAKNYYMETIKDNSDILIPSYQSDIDLIRQEENNVTIRLETLFANYRRTSKRIKSLKHSIKVLSGRTDYTDEALDVLNSNIENMSADVVEQENRLKGIAVEISKQTKDKATISVRLASLKAMISLIKEKNTNLKEMVRAEFISPLKAMDEAENISLKRKLDFLEEQKDILSADPKEVAEELRNLIQSGAEKELVKAKVELLSILAGNTKMNEFKPAVGFRTIISEATVGDLQADKEMAANSLLYSERAMATKVEQINVIISTITSRYELISELELLLNEVGSSLEVEKDSIAIANLKVIKKECEDLIKQNKNALKNIENTLETALADQYEEMDRQLAIQCNVSDLDKEISLKEGNFKEDTVRDRLDALGGLNVMIDANSELVMPTTPENIKEAVEDYDKELGILDSMAGETYNLPADPNTLDKPKQVVEETVDIPIEASPRVVDIPKPEITRDDGLWNPGREMQENFNDNAWPVYEQEPVAEKIPEDVYPRIIDMPNSTFNDSEGLLENKNEEEKPEIVDLGEEAQWQDIKLPEEKEIETLGLDREEDNVETLTEIVPPIVPIIDNSLNSTLPKVMDIRKTSVSDLKALNNMGVTTLKGTLTQSVPTIGGM